MLYDISNSDNAKETLKHLIITNDDILYRFKEFENSYRSIELDDIKRIIKQNNWKTEELKNIKLKVTHITTRRATINEIKSEGLKDLRNVINDSSSELSLFLKKNKIRIDYSNKLIIYKNKKIPLCKNEKIDFCSDSSSGLLYNKLYYDFSVCGLLCQESEEPYSIILNTPEIIEAIGNFISVDLSTLWKRDTKCYEIDFSILEKDTILIGEGGSEDTPENRILTYIKYALEVIWFGQYNNITVVCKNDIEIDNIEILDCRELKRPDSDI